MNQPKYGEIKCQAIKCKNKAYFKCSDDSYKCGVHSRKDKNKTELVKMNKKEKEEYKNKIIKQMWLDVKKENKIELVKMNGLFPKVDIIKGWLNVYPNYKLNWQGVGIVMSSLSPMSLGPVKHNQPDLPEAKNIENFHQFSKYFSQYEIKKEFKNKQIEGFNDNTPHRRKYKGSSNKPDYFIWITKDKIEHHLDYINCRQFYCNFYERLVKKENDFKELSKLKNEGYNLRICGPDAYDLNDIEKDYLSDKVPFGHEKVLYTMLTIENENEWPWRKYKTFEF